METHGLPLYLVYTTGTTRVYTVPVRCHAEPHWGEGEEDKGIKTPRIFFKSPLTTQLVISPRQPKRTEEWKRGGEGRKEGTGKVFKQLQHPGTCVSTSVFRPPKEKTPSPAPVIPRTCPLSDTKFQHPEKTNPKLLPHLFMRGERRRRTSVFSHFF